MVQFRRRIKGKRRNRKKNWKWIAVRSIKMSSSGISSKTSPQLKTFLLKMLPTIETHRPDYSMDPYSFMWHRWNLSIKYELGWQVSNGKLNHFSGTITATTWQKFLVRNSIWSHQFGCKCSVADDICMSWVADMTSTAIGCLTYVRPVRKIKNVKISYFHNLCEIFVIFFLLDSLQSYLESFSIASRKTTIRNYLRTRLNGTP